MDRENKNKPLTPEMKGKLITLYQFGETYSSIAVKLGVHVRIIIVIFDSLASNNTTYFIFVSLDQYSLPLDKTIPGRKFCRYTL